MHSTCRRPARNWCSRHCPMCLPRTVRISTRFSRASLRQESHPSSSRRHCYSSRWWRDRYGDCFSGIFTGLSQVSQSSNLLLARFPTPTPSSTHQPGLSGFTSFTPSKPAAVVNNVSPAGHLEDVLRRMTESDKIMRHLTNLSQQKYSDT